MADKTFQLEVITPDQSTVAGEMTSLQVTASDGMMGILSNHARSLADHALERPPISRMTKIFKDFPLSSVRIFKDLSLKSYRW